MASPTAPAAPVEDLMISENKEISPWMRDIHLFGKWTYDGPEHQDMSLRVSDLFGVTLHTLIPIV